MSTSIPHPLDQLSVSESNSAREVIINARGKSVGINFRSIYLEEPPKKILSAFLEHEHAGRLSPQTPRPSRVARVQYDIIRGDKRHEYMESLVDLGATKEVETRAVDKMHQAALTT